MELKETLEIVIVTYNRKSYLKKTLEQIFAKDSPIKDLEITVLDNCSDDGTSELIQEYTKKYSNLKHIIHNRNIGGNSNIAWSYEISKKPYLWTLCDDDSYDWTNFDEIIKAMEQGYELISTISFDYTEENKSAMIFYNFAFVPGFICKTENITFALMENIQTSISNFFPHLAVVANCFNEDKRIFLSEKDIVIRGSENDCFGSHYRGLNNTVCSRRRNMFWFVGYINACQMIEDKEKRFSVIKYLKHYGKNLFNLFFIKIEKNKLRYNNNLQNLCDIYCGLSNHQRLLFLAAYLLVVLKYVFAKKIFFEPSSKGEWLEYFSFVKQQKELDKLARKYKNKKVLIYGAGLIFETLKENYDLSKLNIIAVSDMKLKEEQTFMGYRAVPFDMIKEINPDVVLVSLYEINKCKRSLDDINMKSAHFLTKKKSLFIKFALRY